MLISLFRLHAVLCLLLALAHASVVLPRDAPTLTIPLRRRSTEKQRRTTPEEFAAMAQRLRNKYNISPRSLERRQGSGSVAIADLSFDSSYSGSISIGTPGARPIDLSCPLLS
jgi:cathepsin D